MTRGINDRPGHGDHLPFYEVYQTPVAKKQISVTLQPELVADPQRRRRDSPLVVSDIIKRSIDPRDPRWHASCLFSRPAN